MSFAWRRSKMHLVLGVLSLLAATAGVLYYLHLPSADHEQILAELPPLRVASLQVSMKEAYEGALGIFWITRPGKLARLVDVEATRRFVRAEMARPGLNQVNAVCTLYQLGDPLADVHQLMTESYWREELNKEPFIFLAYYLATKEEPSPQSLHLAREESLAAILYLIDRRAALTLSFRFAIALRLGMLRLLGTPVPRTTAARLEQLLRVGDTDFVPRRLADSTWKRFLGIHTREDRRWLSSFIRSWNGRSFPETGCGNEHCATKYLLRAINLAYLYRIDLGRQRATEFAAYLVALQNKDGSFRRNLRSTKTARVLETLKSYHCMEFCQIHLWRYINSLNYLIDRHDPDPAKVKRLAARLRR